MNVTVIIPARLGSSRFPRKPLVDILGLPMVEHVRRRVLLNKNISKVIVATCDFEIYDKIKSFGGEVMITDSSHITCNDRVAEIVNKFKNDLIINVQGDEPLINPDILNLLINSYNLCEENSCISLMTKVISKKELDDINEVKVVCDINKNALYFSRLPIPYLSSNRNKNINHFKHIGVYAYESELIERFGKWKPTPAEKSENIDILRFIENGIKIKMVESPYSTNSVDTIDDLKKVRAMMLKDKYFKQYN